jgi:hypothetical protein
MNEGQQSSLRLDLGTQTTKRGDRLAAESSTKVAEKDEKQAMRSDQRLQRLAVGRTIGAKQLGGDTLH